MVEQSYTQDIQDVDQLIQRDEPISPEEVKELGAELEKHKHNPHKALQILKILDRKKITPAILEDTKIGKRLAPVIEQPNPEIADSQDTALLKQISEMKSKLKTKWKQVYKQYKKEAVTEERKDETNHFKITYATRPEDTVKVPYIPENINLGNEKRDRVLKSIVRMLQMPVEKTSQYEKRVMLHALDVAKSVESCINQWCKGDEQRRQEKAQTLISVLVSQPDFRIRLITGEIKPSKAVTMKKEDYNKELKIAKEKKQQIKLQSMRTDWDRNEDKKRPADGEFPCTKCGSQKTTSFEQQTEAVDEQVVYFIECIMCNYRMRL